jgi:hypothetical protein
MSSICNDDSRNEAIAVMLEKIPNSKEDATELLSLCPILEQNEKCINCLNTMLTFLKLFDVIKVTQADEAGRIKIKARSSTASYFLRSLAEYIRNNLILVTNWQRTEAGDKNLIPIRKISVCQVLIKARIQGKNKPVYLVQYDQDARNFQLIGG